jgi:regulator of RNase E activity RraA
VYRDVTEQRELGYPVFGLKPSVVGGKNGRVVAAGFGTTVNIGGIEIATGDIIVGDVSGVVVVPRARAEEVVAAAEAIKEQDLAKAKMLRTGGTLG